MIHQTTLIMIIIKTTMIIITTSANSTNSIIVLANRITITIKMTYVVDYHFIVKIYSINFYSPWVLHLNSMKSFLMDYLMILIHSSSLTHYLINHHLISKSIKINSMGKYKMMLYLVFLAIIAITTTIINMY